MTAEMVLTRKSDGLILTNYIVSWTPWMPIYSHFEHQTQAGTYYPQNLGYASEVQELVALFAPHYPNSTPARFRALWQASRRNHTLTFTDYAGAVSDVRVFETITPDSAERWREVPTKTIWKQTFKIVRLAWVT